VVLLEREEPLVLLEGAMTRARDGRGHSVFIGGEAGIGKTSLVESFVRSQEQGVRVLWGRVRGALNAPAAGALLRYRPRPRWKAYWKLLAPIGPSISCSNLYRRIANGRNPRNHRHRRCTLGR
jgi:hypothetical protein